ncbi:MAG: hypothetical protein KKG59_01290 [Nanoarchaeota archaeon]|nr:hypothetical protein [Nanoarchaeota archaeon]
MDPAIVKKIIEKGPHVFMVLALFYVVEKTNYYLDLFMLIAATINFFIIQKMIAYWKTIVDINKVKKLKKQSKGKALDYFVSNHTIDISKNILYYLSLRLLELIILTYSFYRLIHLWSFLTAQYLFFLGAASFIIHMNTKVFLRHTKKIIAEYMENRK